MHSVGFYRGHNKRYTKEEFPERMKKIAELLLDSGADPFIGDRVSCAETHNTKHRKSHPKVATNFLLLVTLLAISFRLVTQLSLWPATGDMLNWLS